MDNITVKIPGGKFSGIARKGVRYWREEDVIDWLYKCRQAARNASLYEAGDYVDGMIRNFVSKAEPV